VNAILRGYLRELEATKLLLAELKVTQPHLGYSHPEWLVSRWLKRWGAEKAGALMEWNNTPPKTFARVNSLKLGKSLETRDSFQSGTEARQSHKRHLENAGDLLELWREENVEYDFVRRDWFDENLVFELKSHPPFSKLPSFQQGMFYVQDPSTLLAVRELNPRPGETILDLCAAPGGKTNYIAQLMGNQGMVIAHDTAPDRLALIHENCARLGVACVQTLPSPSTSPASLPISHFDKVLVDAPCSNTGVMRRRVDLRWRIRPEEIERLRLQQLELLRHAASLVKPGGILVYSTCSLEPEENQQVIGQFLREQPELKLEQERELMPFQDGVDGAFVGRLVRLR
jgi:16S rRNA (cytosine967-C5)-methyltransferase